MTLLHYIFIGIGILIAIGLIGQIGKYKLTSLSDESIELTRLWWVRPTLRLDNKSIEEIWICTLQGQTTGYVINSDRGRFKFGTDQIDQEDLKRFAFKNKISMFTEEAFHGGGIKKIN